MHLHFSIVFQSLDSMYVDPSWPSDCAFFLAIRNKKGNLRGLP